MKKLVWFGVFLGSLAAACEKASETTPTPSDVAPKVAEEQNPELAFVASPSPLRREPTDDTKVGDVNDPTKKVTNFLTTLQRGETVQVFRVEKEWARIKASDESPGWIKKDALVPAEGVSLATVLEPTKTFNRPDLVALIPNRLLEPATLLLITKTKEQFSEVNVKGQQTTWILSESLAIDVDEVGAAKLLSKAKSLQEKKDPGANELLDLAKSKFSNTKLIQKLTAPLESEGSQAVPVPSTAPTTP